MFPGSTTDLWGIGFDSSGYAWTLGPNCGKVYKLDPATNRRAASMPEGKVAGVGGHYTYSDFTGSTAFNFTAPRGFWDHITKLPFLCALAQGLAMEAFVPDKTSIGVRIRSTDETGNPISDWIPNTALNGTEYFEYPAGAANHRVDLTPFAQDLKGENFELDVRLTTSDREIRPILHGVAIEWGLDKACEAANTAPDIE